MNIYLENDYINIEKIINCGCPFIFIIGGRGTGKTFGALKYVLENNKSFVFMRRLQTQLEMISRPEYSPFNAINNELNYNITTKPNSRYTADILHGDKNLGSMVALSTISNLRGFSSNAEFLIYDEFIPEAHEKPIKEEAAAFFNAYETINRNRELKGLKPLTCICLSNSNTLSNPILIELDLVNTIQKKQQKGQNNYINIERGVAVFLIDNSRISEKKKNTALYKLTKETKFFNMAIANRFIQDFPENIKSMQLEEYNSICEINNQFTIYKHKSEKIFYISKHSKGTPEKFEFNSIDLKRFKRKYKYLYFARLHGKIYFENYELQLKFDNIFSI